MARKPDKSLLIGLADLLALLPWWVGVGAALACYLILHAVAISSLSGQVDAQHLPMAGGVLHGLAVVGQYLLPALFLIAAVLGQWVRRRRAALLASAAGPDSAFGLNEMSWQEFETTVSDAFRLDGFTVEARGGAAPDGGIDLVLHRGGGKYLVQCKQWRAQSVPVGVVRELYGLMTVERAVGGFVVTSGGFTLDAIGFARSKSIVLVDGPMLYDMIKRGRRASAENVRVAAVPNCPLCGKPMVERVVKAGPTAGSLFWGCSQYPVCKGMRDR